MDAMTLLRRFRQNERGAELIEFALVLPLLLAMLAGIVDFGRMFQRLEVTTNAAREGARLASLPGYSQTDVQNRVRAYMDQGIQVGAGSDDGHPHVCQHRAWRRRRAVPGRAGGRELHRQLPDPRPDRHPDRRQRGGLQHGDTLGDLHDAHGDRRGQP